jgi:hypothetical protein
MFIPDPESDFFHPGSKVYKIPDPGSASKNLSILILNFDTKNLSIFILNFDTKFSKIRAGMFIPDPGSGFFPFRIPGSKKHRIPDPEH